MEIKKIYLASPRGFCAGVKRAITILSGIVKKYPPPIFVHHQIVHNDHVVDSFKKQGVTFVEDLNKIPNNSTIVFSAHGSSQSLYKQARQKKLHVIDAVCPLVKKVQSEAIDFYKSGYFIIYIGHKNHPEPLGVISQVPADSITLIESLADARKVNPPSQKTIAVLTQTTLSFNDTVYIIDYLKKKFTDMILPIGSDVCYATQDRQKAVSKLTKKAKVILVVGSKQSSNSNRLKEIADKEAVKAYLINDKSEINNDWFHNIAVIGITAGASTPDYVITDVISYLSNKKTKVEEL